jgi:hypothetical protein
MVSIASLLTACASTSTTGSSKSTLSQGASTLPTASTVQSAPSVTAAPETNAPGDIPDTIAYVPYANAAGRYQFDHPEGWAQTGQGTAVLFTDKYNGVRADAAAGSSAPTPPSANSVDVPALRSSQPAFELIGVSAVAIAAGSGVRIVYRTNSPPDPVTSKSVRQEVQRYEIFGAGHIVVLELFGAVGADNLDPYARMVQSLRIS